MFVDVLRRYLLIVWNFFFGQVSTESIKDSPPSCPEDKPAVSADVVPPPIEVDGKDDKIENGDDEDDDIEEIFDDDEEGEELDLEDEDEIEEDQDEKAAIVPKKPEDKVVTNDIPATKPSVPANKPEEVKAPAELPKPKDEIKKPEPPKAQEEIGEKPKVDIDIAKKSEAPAKPKPELETGEREGAPAKAAPEKDASKFKSEFEIVEREDRDALPPKPKAEFEVVERGTAVKPVLPPPPPPPSSSSSAAAAAVKDDPSRPSVKTGGDDDDKGTPKPAAAPEKATAHVKFQEDDKTTGKDHAPVADFATLEKGEAVVKPPGVTATGRNAAAGDAVVDFLSAEQSHGGQLLKSHHESIQDQQL